MSDGAIMQSATERIFAGSKLNQKNELLSVLKSRHVVGFMGMDQ
jgi:hypothetical protein